MGAFGSSENQAANKINLKSSYNSITTSTTMPITINTLTTLDFTPNITGFDSFNVNFEVNSTNQQYEFATCQFYMNGTGVATNVTLSPASGTLVDYGYRGDQYYTIASLGYTISGTPYTYNVHFNLEFPDAGEAVTLMVYGYRLNQTTGDIGKFSVGYFDDVSSC